MLGLLDRQMEEVISNGNFYKQRIEQLQDRAPRAGRGWTVRRIALERELSEATGELGPARRAGPGRRRAARRAGAARAPRRRARAVARPRARRSYDQARHEALLGRIRALEPLALQAERPPRARRSRRRPSRPSSSAPPARARRRERRRAELRARLDGLGYTEAAFRAAREARAGGRARRAGRRSWRWCARGPRPRRRRKRVEAVARRRAERASAGAGGRGRGARARAASGARPRAHRSAHRAQRRRCVPICPSSPPSSSATSPTAATPTSSSTRTTCATLLDDGDPKPVISGGEEDIANLALRLAISQMIAERAGQPLSLLILDEIFGSLDEDRRAAVVDLLRSLADRFPQVILITHIDVGARGLRSRHPASASTWPTRRRPGAGRAASEAHDVAA